jgi:hypothetical protein
MLPELDSAISSNVARKGIGMIPDMAAICPLKHRNARIMPGRNYPNRHTSKNLAHDIGVAQRIDRNPLRVLPDRPCGAAE